MAQNCKKRRDVVETQLSRPRGIQNNHFLGQNPKSLMTPPLLHCLRALCIVQLNMHYCGAPLLVIIGSHCKWSKWILGCYTKLISCSDLISICSICILPPTDRYWSYLATLAPKIFLLRKLNALNAGDPIPLLPLISSINLIKLHKLSSP